jgi:glycosyltransferase involved in cell wall biosynthesis
MAPPSQPVLALIVAAHNAARTLGRALDSVLRQGYEHWQVYVVDDGSEDGTASVALEYASKDDRIRVLRQARVGAAGARNAAIALISDADYVGYLDADDRLADSHMTSMVALMRDYPGRDIYSSDGLFTYRDGSTAPVFGYKTVVSLNLDDLLRECGILGGGALVRLEVLRALGGFREHMYGEDYDLWLRALAAGYTHVASPAHLYIYDRSIEGQKSSNPMLGYQSAIVALTDLIDAGALTPAQLRAALSSIKQLRVGPQLEAQATYVQGGLERVLGGVAANRIMRIGRAGAWIVRPLRRMLARVRRR